AQVLFLERPNVSIAGLARLAPDVLHDAAALVEIGQNARAANIGELGSLGRNSMLRLFLEVGQVEVLEDQLCDFVDVYFSLVVLLARLIASSRTLPRTLTGLSFVPDHVADLAVSIAGAYVLLFAVVEAELVFI